MSDKKFANLHYPGMAVDPNEVSGALPPEVAARFNEQMLAIGEQGQRALLASAAFIISASPLGVRVAKKLMNVGLGRLGMFGEQTITGAHELPRTSESTLKALSKWAGEEAPWTKFETFSNESIDRRIDDMVRGFSFVIGAGGVEETKRAVSVSRTHAKTAIGSAIAGRSGWYVVVPPSTVCEACLELTIEQGSGFYYPLLDELATKIVNAVVGRVLGASNDSAIFTQLGGSAHKLSGKPGCPKCGTKSG